MYADFLKISQEPSLWELSQKDIEVEQYRVLILSGITPVHSVRLKVKPDGTGTVIVKKLDSGIRIVGERIIDDKYLKRIPQNHTAEFVKLYDTVGFWNILDEDQRYQHGSEVCIHPTMFVFEAVKSGKYQFQHESVCLNTKTTQTLLPAFYKLGGIGASTSDWSLYDYFETGKDK